MGIGLLGCQPVVRAPVTPLPPPSVVLVDRQVISSDEATSVRELRRRGDEALRQERWQDAKDAFEKLLASSKIADDPDTALYLLDLGLAEEGLGNREPARARYEEVAERFSSSPDARTALLRMVAIDDYLEDWTKLAAVGETLLSRTDLDDVDRLTGLGARALSEVEAGEDARAMRDIQDGLDLVDKTSFGSTGRLPNGAAQLRFALAEVRRVRSERVALAAAPKEFLGSMEARCEGLLAAQSAYTDAMRATEPHWTAMSAFRIGAMYGRLHRELMAIPPTPLAKTASDKDLFFAMMHVRYRVLLEKGLEMMKRTAALETQSAEVTPWVEKAKAAMGEMRKAIDEEKAALAKLPYSEATVQAALDDLEKKTLARRAKEVAKPASHGQN
jgi:tetratricopeptide (TPR) repeat protein